MTRALRGGGGVSLSSGMGGARKRARFGEGCRARVGGGSGRAVRRCEGGRGRGGGAGVGGGGRGGAWLAVGGGAARDREDSGGALGGVGADESFEWMGRATKAAEIRAWVSAAAEAH